MAKPKGKHSKPKESYWTRHHKASEETASAPAEATTDVEDVVEAVTTDDGDGALADDALVEVNETVDGAADEDAPAASVTEVVPMAEESSEGDEGAWSVPVIGPDDAVITELGAVQDDEVYRQKRRRRSKAFKTAGITVGAVVGSVVGIYLIGVAVFSILFFPQTYAAGADLSFKNTEGAHQELADQLSDHDFMIVGQGIRMTMTADEAGLGLNDDIINNQLRETVNPWTWPYEVFQVHDLSDAFALSIGSTNLADTLRSHADEVNATASQPVNATVGYDQAAGTFVVIPEQYGTVIDSDKLVEYVSTEIMELPSKIMLPDEVLMLPEVLSDDPRLQSTIIQANNYLGGTIDYTYNGETVAQLDKDTIGSFVTIAPDLTVGVNEDAVEEWAAKLADGYDTVGTERTYTRPDGKVIKVSGGSYGWSLSEQSLKDQAYERMNAGTAATMDLPFNKSAAVKAPVGSADWGPRYVDVDLSEQHVRFYDDSGALVWESDCVSGLDTDRKRTPTGVYFIESNAGAAVLRGYETDGSQYESHVRYWMPFLDNAWGLHDADWRSSFGGTIYAYNGSHGCVNLPVAKARELSSMIRVGDPVIVHY